MLYKFKSQAVADVIMLKASAEELLKIIGKPVSPAGIVTVEQIPGAIAAIEAAIAAEERARAQAREEATQDGEDGNGNGSAEDAVSLRQRAAPLLDMLRRSAAEGREVTW